MADKFLEGLAEELKGQNPTPQPEPEVKDESPKNTEPAKEPQEPKGEPQAEPQTFDWSKINSLLGRDEETGFKGEEDFKTFFDEMNSKVGESSEYEKRISDFQTREQEYKAILDYVTENEGQFDPINTYFGGDKEAYKRKFLADGLKSKGYNEAVINQVVDPNLETMDSLDVVALGRQLESKRLNGKTEYLKRTILEDIGVDLKEAQEEGKTMKEIIAGLTPEQQTKLDIEADKVVRDVKNVINGIEVPEPTSPFKKIIEDNRTRKETAQKIKADWEGKEAATKLSEKLDVIKLEHEGFEFPYKVSDAEKAEMAKEIALEAALFGRELNAENMDDLVARKKQDYFGKNGAKIFSAALKQYEVKSKEKIEKDVYNGKQQDMQREKVDQNTSDPFSSAFDNLYKSRDVRNL